MTHRIAQIVAILFLCFSDGTGAAKAALLPSTERAHGDVALYRAVAHKVASGESYYSAVAELHRARGYPTRPFVAVRPPLLAWFEALVGDGAMPWLGAAGILAAAGLWVWRLRAEAFAVRFLGSGAVLAAGLPLAFSPFVFVHDFWTGLAITCALACEGARSRAALGLLAACIRELSFPFLWVHVAFEKDRRPALLATIVALVFLTIHALSIHPGGLASPGWLGERGPVAALDNMIGLTLLQFIPRSAALVLCALPLLGWLNNRIAFAWFAGFWVVIAVLARADNPNWVLNLLPAWFVGYALLLPKFTGTEKFDWHLPKTLGSQLP